MNEWENDDVCDWLEEIRLTEYALPFVWRSVTGQTLSGLRDQDLISFGIKNPQHRREILISIEVFGYSSTSSYSHSLSLSLPQKLELHKKIEALPTSIHEVLSFLSILYMNYLNIYIYFFRI